MFDLFTSHILLHFMTKSAEGFKVETRDQSQVLFLFLRVGHQELLLR